MEKNYHLANISFYNLRIKEIRYNYNYEVLNKPTRWIRIIIHHTNKNKNISDIINKHIKKNHWSSIGYHFLINKRGKIIYSRPLSNTGAHTIKHNRNSIGIALLGNYDKEMPNNKQLESLNKLCQTLKKEYPIKEIIGHNQAIYKILKKKYWKQNLPTKNLLQIKSKENYEKFVKTTTTKILKKNSDDSTISLIKRFKSCPGFNMYKEVNKLNKKIKK